MALNLDTALRVVAKVSGLNDFKALTEGLQGVEGASKNANSGLQQTANESQRVSQEAAKAASTVKVQATALQDLQAKTRASAAEMRRMGAETTGLGGVLQRLRGQSGGVFDGLSGSTVKAANNIRGLQQSIQPTEAQLARLRGEMLQLGASSKTTERSIEQQIAALKNLRSQAEVNGGVYQALSGDIAKLQAASKGLDATSTTAAGGLKRVAAASAESGDAIRRQIQSLTALQGSLKGAGVDMGATAQQVEALKQKAAQLGQAWEPGIRGLKLLAQESAKSVEAQSGSMTRLQGVLSKAGEGYQRLGREIDAIRQKAAGLDLSKGINFTPGGVASGVGGAVRNIVQMRQDLSRSMMGRVVLTGEGLAATGVAGAAGMGAASGLGGMAGGAQAVAASLDAIAAKAAALPGVLKPLGGLLSEPAAAAAGGVAQWASALTSAQAKLQALATPFEAIGTAISSIGPEAAAAAGVASLAIAGVYQVLKSQAGKAEADLEASFQGISDAAQKVLTDLVRIYDKVPNARLEAQQQLRDRNLQRLGEVPSDSVEARRAANAVVTAEREITKIQGERAALLDNARQQQNQATEALKSQVAVARERLEAQRRLTAETKQTAAAEREARAIAGSIRRNQERLARDEQRLAPQREAEAAAAARTQELLTAARQRLELQRQLTEEQKRTNAQLAEERAIRGSIRRNQERVAAEQARAAAADADLRRRAAAAFAPSRVLALPAAGQSSFAGTVNAAGLGGGARARLQNFETAGTRDDIGAAMASRSAQALQQQAQATQRTRGALAELFLTIDRVTAASNGSINALQRQRSAWEALRLAVNPAAPAYAKATAEVKRLDDQLQKLTGTQQKAQRQGIGREAIGGALGTLATGGGAQGAIGALAGGLAFSGGAAGLAAGGAVAAIGGAAALAARVGVEAETAQIRLKALTDQFGEYNQAQAAAARISGTLRISTIEAQDGFGKLYAALRPTGVTLQEIEDAFVGFTAAARASGATATESSAALLQLKQALGSGVLQGDELRAIREQAPAVGQAIAREMGVTIGELKKLGSEGQITTDIVLRALAKLKGEKLDQLNAQFNTSAQTMADLKIATEDLGRTIAKVFGPTAVGAVRIFTEAIRRLNDATVAFRDPTAATAAQVIRDGRMPGTAASQSVFFRGAGELFKGTSGAGGVGLTGLEAEAKELSRTRRQPYDKVLFELMQNRLSRVDGAASGNQQQQDARGSAESERQAARARATQSAADAAGKKAEADQKRAEQEAEQRRKAELDYQNDLFNIRLNAERRLRDFREQSLERAKQMERDLADQRLELERTTEERRRRATGQLQDVDLMGQISQFRAAGIDTSALEEQLKINQERRRISEEVLKNELDATDRKTQLEQALEAYRVSVAQGIRQIMIDAGEQWAERVRQGARDAASIMGGSSAAGSAAPEGVGPSSGVARLLQAASSKLGLFAGQTERCADAIRELFKVAGIAIGTTRKAWDGLASGRSLASSFFGSDIGQRINNRRDLRPGDLVGFERTYGSWGPGVQTHVGMYAGNGMMFDHSSRGGLVRRPLDTFAGKFMYGVRPYALMQGGMPGAANGIRSLSAELRPAAPLQPMNPTSLEIPGMELINQGAAAFRDAIDANRKAGLLGISAEALSNQRNSLDEITNALNAQKRTTADQLADYTRLLELQRGGLSPEIAQQRVEAERLSRVEEARLRIRLAEYDVILKDSTLTDEARTRYEGFRREVEGRLAAQGSIVEGLTLEQQALERLRDLEAERQQLIEGISGTIGNGLTSAMDALINGTESWGDSLRTIGATVLRDIARQLAQIYLIQPATQGIQGLLGGLLGGGGGVATAAAGSGFSPFTAPMLTGVPTITGTFANGGIMTTDGPLPLRTYARGGIASSPQLALFGEGRMPEAFVPLPDGRRIPVAMQGGGNGTTNVVVNVNMETGETDVNSGERDGQILGKALSEAVQAELIRQKRPGGILYR